MYTTIKGEMLQGKYFEKVAFKIRFMVLKNFKYYLYIY